MKENNNEVDSETLTVMLTDIVGYTKKTANISREEFTNLHDTFDNIALPIFEQYQGKVIKKMGDAFLLTFKSPTNAIQCGIELQNAFAQWRNESGRNLHIRVSLHTGEVLHRHNDIYGDVVNATSRIESATPADQIFFSEAVFSAMNKSEIPYQYLGQKRFKGLNYPIRLFRVRNAKESGRRFRARSSSGDSTFLLAFLLIILVLALGVGAYFLMPYIR